MSETQQKKKAFRFPHAFVLIFFIAALAAVMANVVPAGQYDRVLNEATGRNVVDADSFHYVEQVGCSVADFFMAFPKAFQSSAQIMFFIVFAYFFVRMLLKNGTWLSDEGEHYRYMQVDNERGVIKFIEPATGKTEQLSLLDYNSSTGKRHLLHALPHRQFRKNRKNICQRNLSHRLFRR